MDGSYRKQLLNSGLNDAQITNMEVGISQYGMQEVLNDPELTASQRKLVTSAYGADTTGSLTRESVAALYNYKDGSTNKTGGFLGLGGKSDTDRLNDVMGTIQIYRNVGIKDEDILKKLQEKKK